MPDTQVTKVGTQVFVHPATPPTLAPQPVYTNISVGDTDYNIPTTATVVTLSAVLGHPRIWRLPPAAMITPGRIITLIDAVSGIGTNHISVSGDSTTTDTIDTATSAYIINWSNGSAAFMSDGISSWQTTTITPVVRQVAYTDPNSIDVLLPSQIGNTGDFLQTNGFHTLWAKLSGLIPAGGTVGQTLKKASSADYDVVWG